MSTKVVVPEQFKNLVDLASDTLGAFALWATDDYFAEKEALLRPWPAEWREGAYTDKGKWMDGWESQRRRTPGHDVCVIRLGLAGSVRGLVVDTTHFKGNAPQEVLLEGLEAAHTATPDELNAATGWIEILPKSPVKPDFPNVFDVAASARVTHVRLRIFPDGGVARLRVYGEVMPEDAVFHNSGSIDLVAVENGGTLVTESDQFFGPASNLLLPGRGVNMGDGWETKRRRTPGSDWAVLKTGRRGVVERIEIDTHFFKGNAPQAVLVEALDETELAPGELQGLLRAPTGWKLLLGKSALVQHRRHTFTPDRPMAATHLRVHMFPHGGINRMRMFGYAVDTAAETKALDAFNAMPAEAARELLLSFCGSERYAETLESVRPFESVRILFAASDQVFWALDEKDLLEAYSAHPKIGETKQAETQTAQSATWSGGEQAGVAGSAEATKARLAELNRAYAEKFGFIYIVFATGKSAALMLEILEGRIANDRATEIENAAREQAKITRLRIGKWLRSI